MAQINLRNIVVTGFWAVVSLIAATQISWCRTGKELRGLPNFGRVTDNLYRGGQPTSDGLKALRAMEVGIVVNLREDRTEVATEKRHVESLGMKSSGIPWSANPESSSAQNVKPQKVCPMLSDEQKRVLGERGRARTFDPCLKRALLYQLSYAPAVLSI